MRLLKKAAMFGLDARIKKLCHPELVSGSATKLGAMFGLDARIALAIFGAISVISGAALYSAIQGAKVVSIITDLKEIEKAYEQFYLDNGKLLPQHSTAKYQLSIKFLNYQKGAHSYLENGHNGPYLPYEQGGHETRLAYPKYISPTYGEVQILLHEYEEDNTSQTGLKEHTECTWTKTCYTWISIYPLPDSLVFAIDEKIDGGDGGDLGNIRYSGYGSSVNKEADLFMKSFAVNR